MDRQLFETDLRQTLSPSKYTPRVEKTSKGTYQVTDLYTHTQAKLDNTKSLYESMMLEHQKLIEKYEELQESNNKLQVNNARLLRKLEQK